MNFFIDFDHTLYRTEILVKSILSELANFIAESSGKNYNEILDNLKDKFSRGKDKIYDTYELIEYFSKTDKYNYDENKAIEIVNKLMLEGEKYLYDDAIPFLKYLKQEKHKVYILTYSESGLSYQSIKLAGSGILKYVDGVFETTTMKGKMPLDYSKCIFIDDKPEDLISLCSRNPQMVYRIRRQNGKYADKEVNFRIEEVENLMQLVEKIKNI